ncbi:NADH-dependent dehydrogenase [Planctomycetales bacterium 10988]|nr:NADH-dependent dehydrogenase [Planctomycetales bacterium 10988]
MPDRRLRGVGIGAGYFSQYHYEAWSRIAEVDLVAVCDLDAEKAKRAAQRYGIPRHYHEVCEMLDREKPDFVDIITRPDSHLAFVREAAARGMAIICQKPLAPTTAEATVLVETAEAAGVRLMVHENFRFQPWHREIKRLLDQKILGEKLHSIQIQTRLGDGWQADAYQARQPYFREMPRFLIYETGVHFIDTLQYLFGPIDGVSAILRRQNQEIFGEDAGVVCFEFSNSAFGVWNVSRFHESPAENTRYTFGEFLIEGEEGSLRLNEEGELFLKPLGQPEQKHDYIPSKVNFAGDCVYETQKHFCDSLLHEQPFETSGLDYLQVMRIMDCIYEAAAAGKTIRGLSKKDSSHASN